MSTFGVIFCGFNTASYLPRSLGPWIDARETGMSPKNRCRILICAVSCPFDGFNAGVDDGTTALLQEHRAKDDIDHIVTSNVPVKETEARGEALRWLVAAGADILVQWDSDEFTTIDQLKRILAFVESKPHHTWFRLSLKNRVFTPDQYLVEPFTPPRIHRVYPPGSPYRAHSFYQDNNIAYGGTITRDLIPDERFASLTVPKSVAFIDHWTWLNDGPNGRSRRKLEYQMRRWGTCSFDWDDARGGLIFRDGLPVPETARDV